MINKKKKFRIMEPFTQFRDRFYAQKLPGYYKKRLTLKMCSFFVFLGIANIVLGIISFIPFRNITKVEIPYSEPGSVSTKFILNKTIPGPVYFYLQISDFYQSFFQYARSFSSGQLKGNATESVYDCGPLKYKDGDLIYPCGLIANSFVFDEFKLLLEGEEIEISVDDIAWNSAIERIQPSEYPDGSVVSPPLWPEYKDVPDLNGDERFANWMLPASFPTFRKLFGKINTNLVPGKYELIIDNITLFGKKRIIMTNGSWLGDENYFLSVSLIVSGAFLIICTVTLWCLRNKYGY